MALTTQGQPKPRYDAVDPKKQPGRVISLFTSSWSLGALLFLCLFLPSFEGCHGTTVYPIQVFGDVEPKLVWVLRAFLGLSRK